MEMLCEGAMVYYYGPPTSRKGLPRRLQDQTSWTGPAVVAALERKEGSIKRDLIRYRNKLKGVPLEYVRLATLEEVESSKIWSSNESNHRSRRWRVLPKAPIMEFSGDEEVAKNPGHWEDQPRGVRQQLARGGGSWCCRPSEAQEGTF